MSALVTVKTQARVFSRAFFNAALARRARHVPAIRGRHEAGDLSLFALHNIELHFFSFPQASVTTGLYCCLKYNRFQKL